MFRRVFPKQFDNDYRGHRIGIWIFALVLLVETAIGVNSLFIPRNVATGADDIPIDKFGADGAGTVIALFALLELFRVLIALQGAIVLIRYRAMIPMMYVLLLILQLGSKAVLQVYPIARGSTPMGAMGSAVVLFLLGAIIIGFVLSLLGTNRSSTQSTTP